MAGFPEAHPTEKGCRLSRTGEHSARQSHGLAATGLAGNRSVLSSINVLDVPGHRWERWLWKATEVVKGLGHFYTHCCPVLPAQPFCQNHSPPPRPVLLSVRTSISLRGLVLYQALLFVPPTHPTRLLEPLGPFLAFPPLSQWLHPTEEAAAASPAGSEVFRPLDIDWLCPCKEV